MGPAATVTFLGSLELLLINDINQLILYLNDHEATFGSKLSLLNSFQALVFAMWLTSLDQFYKLQNSLFMRSKSRNNQTWE